MRLDQFITEKLKISKNKAQNLIKSLKVSVNNKIIKKSWFEVNFSDKIDISESEELNYVARSALKLKWFFEENFIDLEDKICLDVWSSTWWFCQILLEKWVSKIFAVDVWNSQLHSILRENKNMVYSKDFKLQTINRILINHESI